MTGGGGGAGARALAALDEAKKYLGTPYQWGGSTPQTGFDCSGLAQWAYAKAGHPDPARDRRADPPRATAHRSIATTSGRATSSSSASRATSTTSAMSLGGDKFIHAPHTGDVVKIASLKESYFSTNYAGARRFDHSAPVADAARPPAASAAPAAPGVDPKAVAEAQAARRARRRRGRAPGLRPVHGRQVQEARRHQPSSS